MYLMKTSDDNLKYLINLDRNKRRHNTVCFGIPEDETLDIGGQSYNSDFEKVDGLLAFIGVNTTNITDMFSLGKKR